jgi:crotonobetainyl-CoA:carnitine CoA-transferase CaiB-like acyl-CoA transferase
VLDYTMNGRVPESLGNRDYAAIQGCYPCDGQDRWVTLTLPDDDSWAGFCRAAAGTPGLENPAFATAASRYAHHDAIDQVIVAWTRKLSREDAVAKLRAEGLMAGPVLDDGDLFKDEQMAARGYFQEVDQVDVGLHRYPGFPYRLQNRPLGVRMPPVRLGEHNEYVYKQLLGVSDAEYAQLEAEGHIGTEYAPHIR